MQLLQQLGTICVRKPDVEERQITESLFAETISDVDLLKLGDRLSYPVCRSLSASAMTFSSSSGSTGFMTYAFAPSKRDCKALSRPA